MTMESVEVRVRQGYFRKTAAHPDGQVVHHGDCDFFTTIRHCSCGLLHLLRPYAERAEELYPDFWQDLAVHDKARDEARPKRH